LPAAERSRWLELLSYVDAMLYHDRTASEREELRNLILASVRTDERRREVEAMMRTGADVLRDEGRHQGEVRARQDILLRQLRVRFKRVPKAVERTVKATEDVARLDTWIERFVNANTLDEVGIEAGG
jgi:hypothetical protein